MTSNRLWQARNVIRSRALVAWRVLRGLPILEVGEGSVLKGCRVWGNVYFKPGRSEVLQSMFMYGSARGAFRKESNADVS